MPKVADRRVHQELPTAKPPRTLIELAWGILSRGSITLNAALLLAVLAATLVTLVLVLGPTGVGVVATAIGAGASGRWLARRTGPGYR